jgi:HTH-like domain
MHRSGAAKHRNAFISLVNDTANNLNSYPGRDDEGRLTADIIERARQYGYYGYRKIAALLRQAGWAINYKRVE